MNKILSTLTLAAAVVIGTAGAAFAHTADLSGNCATRSYVLTADNDNLNPAVKTITGPVSGLVVGQTVKNVNPTFTATGAFSIVIKWSGDNFETTVSDANFTGGTCVGPQGPAGTNGSNGSNGTNGSKGDKGDTGATGAAGVKGDTGAAGQPGAPGAPGLPGTPGAKGETGDSGVDGVDGAQGEAGLNGTDGATGANGQDGFNGKPGVDGINGVDGNPGYSVCPDGSVEGMGVIPNCAGHLAAQGPKGDKGDTGAAGKLVTALTTPDTTDTTAPATPVGTLPHTGTGSDLLVLIGGALVLGGGALLVQFRLRRG